MWALQQSPGMKSLEPSTSIEFSCKLLNTLFTCTEFLMFDSMLSCKLEGCLKIKRQDSTDKCVAFPHHPQGRRNVGCVYVIKQSSNTAILWKILYSWSGIFFADEESLLLKRKIRLFKKRNRKKETSSKWNMIL